MAFQTERTTQSQFCDIVFFEVLKHENTFLLVPLGTDEILETGAMFFLTEVLTYTWQYLYLGFADPFPVKEKKKSKFNYNIPHLNQEPRQFIR